MSVYTEVFRADNGAARDQWVQQNSTIAIVCAICALADELRAQRLQSAEQFCLDQKGIAEEEEYQEQFNTEIRSEIKQLREALMLVVPGASQ